MTDYKTIVKQINSTLEDISYYKMLIDFEILLNSKTKKDYDLLKKTVTGVVKCIQNDIQCISPDKNCYHCEYRKVCDL